MTRQLEMEHEQKLARRLKKVGQTMEFGLAGSLAHAGAELVGFSVKYSEADCLLTLRVVLAGRPQVAFVGAGDLSTCFLKAAEMA
ncbi:MAG: hypothetical protein KAR39_13250, partial [Thermoplasmata archaeon]|nr:hypothetical protein [Thermoplasmata archaeon]